MKTYTVLHAADIPHYVTFEVQASTVEDAVAAARAQIDSGDVLLEDPDWEGIILSRIVHVDDETGQTVANDIPLDNKTLVTGSAVREAIQYTLECLHAFKADWLSNQGLNVVVEKLETALIELGGVA